MIKVIGRNWKGSGSVAWIKVGYGYGDVFG